LLRFPEAQQRVLSATFAMGDESVQLQQAYGRHLAEEIIAPLDLPPWDNSAMDGYAVRAADLQQVPVTLGLNEVVAAGQEATIKVESGSASAIMTGAPVPLGADTVVILENTDGSLSGSVRVLSQTRPGANIRRRGEDVRKGQSLLLAGRRLEAAEVGLLASMGLQEVRVAKRPVVAILSTGNELVTPGTPLGPGQIYSSNTAALRGLVLEAGAEFLDLGAATDTEESVLAALSRAGPADVIVTTGGVSAGVFDVVRSAFEQVGVCWDFWKIKMKPGKPVAFGWLNNEHGRSLVFGLPGNPVSCMVTFLQLVRPALLSMQGEDKIFLPMIKATAGQTFTKKSDRTEFVRVCLERQDQHWVCFSTGSQSSGVLTSMVKGDGFALFGEEVRVVEKGAPVHVQIYNPRVLHRATEVDG
jgi:molybdopterin molybdotransferase